MIPPASPEFMMGGGPPVPQSSPKSPTLSSLPVEGEGAGGEGGGVARLVFSLEKAVETLARAIPEGAEEAGQIRQLLRAMLMKATQKGNEMGQEGAGRSSYAMTPMF